jgi:hypothetical protein
MSYLRLDEAGELELDLESIEASLRRDEEARLQEHNGQQPLETLHNHVVAPTREAANSILDKEVTPNIHSQAYRDAVEKKIIRYAPLYDATKPLKEQFLQFKGKNYLKIMLSYPLSPTEMPYIILYDDMVDQSTTKKLLIDISVEGAWHTIEVYHCRDPKLHITDAMW